MIETWRKVIGYEGFYEVSSSGRVRSYWNNRHGILEVPKLIVPKLAGNGYLYVNLSDGKTKKSKKVSILVAKAFVANPEKKITVNHIDGNKLNNHYLNLEWATYSENIKHAFSTGLNKPRLGMANRSKLSDEDVLEIRRLGQSSSTREIGERFGISHTVVRRILSRQLWKHI